MAACRPSSAAQPLAQPFEEATEGKPAPAAPPAPAPPAPPPVPEDGFELLPQPQPGDWLHRFKEDGQTFDQYTASCANRKSAARTTIYLQPYGAPDARTRDAIDAMREYSATFFGVTCVVRPPVPLPDECHILPRDQYNATMLIDRLAKNVPEDALAVAGISDKDLFSKGLNFVFGEGSLSNRCGVYSLVRFEREPRLFLRRSLQLLSHEVGHIFSIEHCIKWKCVMCGANSLAESDRHPLHLCPDDLRKLQWNTGFDVRERYRALAGFFDRHGLADEAAWCRVRLR